MNLSSAKPCVGRFENWHYERSQMIRSMREQSDHSRKWPATRTKSIFSCKKLLSIPATSSAAAFWLLNNSYYRKDFKATLRYSDILLRTRPELGTYIYSYLALLASEAEGRGLLVDRLASEPAWRRQFFQVFPLSSKDADAPLLVLTALRDAGKPVSDKELAAYLNSLISTNRIDAAYNAWLQFLTEAQLEKIELLTNGRFENKPSGLPFDWKIDPGVNAIADFVSLAKNSGARAFHIKFGDGRIQFPRMS